jgi:hypothetical protein
MILKRWSINKYIELKLNQSQINKFMIIIINYIKLWYNCINLIIAFCKIETIEKTGKFNNRGTKNSRKKKKGNLVTVYGGRRESPAVVLSDATPIVGQRFDGVALRFFFFFVVLGFWFINTMKKKSKWKFVSFFVGLFQ